MSDQAPDRPDLELAMSQAKDRAIAEAAIRNLIKDSGKQVSEEKIAEAVEKLLITVDRAKAAIKREGPKMTARKRRKNRKKTQPTPTMGEVWVMMATTLAFQKAHNLSDEDYFSALKDWKKMFRKLDAFRLDPANKAAIVAEHAEAAKLIGYRGVTKH